MAHSVFGVREKVFINVHTNFHSFFSVVAGIMFRELLPKYAKTHYIYTHVSVNIARTFHPFTHTQVSVEEWYNMWDAYAKDPSGVLDWQLR